MTTKLRSNQVERLRVNVRDFGAKGDGVTDDTAAIKAAFAAAGSSNWVVEFPTAEYVFNTDVAFGINLQSVSNFRVVGNGSILKTSDGTPGTGNGVFMYIQDCVNGSIEGLTFDGNLPTRTGNVVQGDHCVKLRDANKRIKFINCRFINAVSDGFYVDQTLGNPPSEDIELVNCEASGCYRGGVSVIDSLRFKVSGGRFHNNVGSAPQHGIDFEDDGIGSNVEPTVIGAKFDNNGGVGLQISGLTGTTDAQISNCYFKENGLAAINVGTSDGVYIKDSVFGGVTSEITRAVLDIGASVADGDVTLENLTFRDINPAGSGKACIYVHSAMTGFLKVDGITVNGFNCQGIFSDTDNAHIANVTLNNGTGVGSNYPFFIGGSRTKMSNIKQYDCSLGSLVGANGVGTELDGFSSVDCDGAYAIYFNTSDVSLRNASVIQTTSIPSGQTAIIMSGAPNCVSNLVAKSAGTNYNSTNTLQLTGGVSSSTIFGPISGSHWGDERLSADIGDNDLALVRGVDAQVVYAASPLSTTRTVTLPTTGVKNGDKFKVVRTDTATGASNLVVATITPSNDVLQVGEYLMVQYDGSAWRAIEKGNVRN